MGILDDLREEASQKQIDLQEDTLLKEKLEHNYQILILPKMQQLFSYFKELIDYLSIIENPIEIPEYSKRYPQMGMLYQQNYRLSTDKHGGLSHYDKLTEIYLRFNCLGNDDNEETFSHHIQHKVEADLEKEFLSSHKIPFNYDQSFGSNKGGAVTFQISRKIPVLFKFSVDYENSLIVLDIQNHENFEQRNIVINPNQIDEDNLDKLARYILRKDDDFLRMEIDDASKEKIREQINLQKKAHADELRAAAIREENERKKQEINNVKNKIKTFFDKISK
ncbi:MAG: hypothetical protein OQL19_00495 [Gammaproteobacteria bacterium]|nr:hypothetical protein [Gammaproteobacteria bacterium]